MADVTFHIKRFDPAADAAPHYQDFVVQAEGSMTVLEALFAIQEKQDGSLAFRYCCRSSICGSCAMVINGKFDLACRTSIGSLKTSFIIVEPLPSLEIQKDLVVDMEPFWQALLPLDKLLWTRILHSPDIATRAASRAIVAIL